MYKNTLTDEEYVKHEGDYCPVCESNDISVMDEIQADCDYAWENLACNTCGARWGSHYKLDSYDLDEPDFNHMDSFEVVKTFSGAVTLLRFKDKLTDFVIKVKDGEDEMWFADTAHESPRIERIKDKKIREEVKQALTEIKMLKKLDQTT